METGAGQREPLFLDQHSGRIRQRVGSITLSVAAHARVCARVSAHVDACMCVRKRASECACTYACICVYLRINQHVPTHHVCMRACGGGRESSKRHTEGMGNAMRMR